ncbi:hypothetical protein FQN54_009734 [Arachnomyces sp. PD_36]|nr:hypothetical protein FQN54_009734 [Arachnomyces sp. PD_36]
MPASIDKLPLEIILLIVNGVENQQDKLSLASCSSRMRRFSLPCCYTSLELAYPSPPKLCRLLRTFRRNPQLGQAVRFLRLDGWSAFPPRRPCQLPEPSSPDIEITAEYALLLEMVAEYLDYVPSDFLELEKSAKCGVSDVFVAILLTQLPNVRELSLQAPVNPNNVSGVLEDAVLRCGRFCSEQLFPELTHVTIGPSDRSLTNRTLFPQIFVWPFYTFPKMCSITTYWITDSAFYALPYLVPLNNKAYLPATSLVTHIDLVDSENAFSVVDMISACPNLVSLKVIRTGDCMDLDVRFLQHPRAALEEVQSTLQTLWISASSFNLAHVGGPEGNSWAHFPVLKNLLLNVDYLLDTPPYSPNSLAAILPASLETLAMSECSTDKLEETIIEVERLVIDSRERFPLLREVTIEVHFLPSPSDPDEKPSEDIGPFLRKVRNLGADTGIRVDLVAYPNLLWSPEP